MIKTLKRGNQYMKVWPNHAVVGNLPESRLIPALKLGSKLLPVAAVC